MVNCCRLRIIFKSQNKHCNNFHFNDPAPQVIASGWVYKFQCGLCNKSYHSKCGRDLDVRSGEDIGITYLTNRRGQTTKDNTVCYHLLNCD